MRENVNIDQLFIKGLKLLSLSGDEQLSSLPNFVCKPDELALELNDVLFFLKDDYSNTSFSETQIEKIKHIDKLCHAIKVDIRTEEGVMSSSEWCEIRVLARDLLKELDERNS